MMWRFVIALLAALLLMTAASIARIPFGAPGGTLASALACTFLSGSPSPNGSCIAEPGPGSILTDKDGNTWQFDGNVSPLGNDAEFTINGSAFTSGNMLEVNQPSGGLSHSLFLQQAFAIPAGQRIWQLYTSSGFIPALSPTAAALGNIFVNTTTSAAYASPAQLASSAASGQTISIPALPGGMSGWPGMGAVSGLSSLAVNCASGSRFLDGEIGIFSNNVTLTDCENDYTQYGPSNGPYMGVRIAAGSLNPTLIDFTAHDDDDGIEAGGLNGLITITAPNISHNGYWNPSGDCQGFDHNIYLSYDGNGGTPRPDTSTVSLTGAGGQSVDVRCQGDYLKARVNGGTISNLTSGHTGRYSDDGPNWVWDFPCGGPFTVSHGTAERMQNTAGMGGNYGVVSYGEEWPAGGTIGNNWNCPPAGTFTASASNGSPTLTGISSTANIVVGAIISGPGIPANDPVVSTTSSTVTLQSNATANETAQTYSTTRNFTATFDHIAFIDDGDSSSGSPSAAIRCGNGTTNCTTLGYSITVTNSYVVAAAFPGCSGAYLGTGVIDGGGNACYASRAAAQAARASIDWNATDRYGNPCCAYPWMPPNP